MLLTFYIILKLINLIYFPLNNDIPFILPKNDLFSVVSFIMVLMLLDYNSLVCKLFT